MKDPRQLDKTADGASLIPKKKQLKVLSAHQRQALERISSSSSAHVIGIDEVGKGCWAGPVTVAAVVMPRDWDHPEVVDSKRTTHKQRVRLWSEVIYPNALACCVLSATNQEIDRYGLEPVTRRLTEAAAMYGRLRYHDALVVEDGDIPVEVDGSIARVAWLPKADVLVPSVSAASILAKLSRDTFMQQLDRVYPGYDFASNMGYHSKTHVEGLDRQGVCGIHRLSFKPVRAYAQVKGVRA